MLDQCRELAPASQSADVGIVEMLLRLALKPHPESLFNADVNAEQRIEDTVPGRLIVGVEALVI